MSARPSSPSSVPLPVTRLCIAALALLTALAYALFVGIGGIDDLGSRVIYGLLGTVALFPIERVAALWRWLTDRRPAPSHYGTAAALDPREGHTVPPDLHLVGRIVERRRL